MVDVHVIFPAHKPDFTRSCIESLKCAQTNIFLIPENSNPIGINRQKGYSLGAAEFKASADYDDIYNRTVFTSLERILQENPGTALAYTSEAIFDEDGIFSLAKPSQTPYDKFVHRARPQHVHGVQVYRTYIIESAPSIIWSFPLVDWALSLWASTQGKIQHFPAIGRYWRRHTGQSSSFINEADIVQVQKWFAELG